MTDLLAAASVPIAESGTSVGGSAVGAPIRKIIIQVICPHKLH